MLVIYKPAVSKTKEWKIAKRHDEQRRVGCAERVLNEITERDT